MDFLMAENSAVDNNDRLRRSSQVSSKTTKTKNMDDTEDKIINKKSELEICKIPTQTTKVMGGIEDKVIVADYS